MYKKISENENTQKIDWLFNIVVVGGILFCFLFYFAGIRKGRSEAETETTKRINSCWVKELEKRDLIKINKYNGINFKGDRK